MLLSLSLAPGRLAG